MHMHASEIAQIAGDVNCVVDCTFHWISVGLLNFQSLFLHGKLAPSMERVQIQCIV